MNTAKRSLGEPKMDPAVARERLAGMPWFPRFSLTVGGLGFAPFASGTWGSLPPCIAVLGLVVLLPAGLGWVIDAVLVVLLVWAALGCVRWTAAAEDALGIKDPSCIVLDEIAGMSIALLGLHWPLRSMAEAGSWSWAGSGVLGVGMAFLLFRFFDVLKPPPCKALERIGGGWGVLLDDVLAGVYACFVMHVLVPLAR